MNRELIILIAISVFGISMIAFALSMILPNMAGRQECVSKIKVNDTKTLQQLQYCEYEVDVRTIP